MTAFYNNFYFPPVGDDAFTGLNQRQSIMQQLQTSEPLEWTDALQRACKGKAPWTFERSLLSLKDGYSGYCCERTYKTPVEDLLSFIITISYSSQTVRAVFNRESIIITLVNHNRRKWPNEPITNFICEANSCR